MTLRRKLFVAALAWTALAWLGEVLARWTGPGLGFAPPFWPAAGVGMALMWLWGENAIVGAVLAGGVVAAWLPGHPASAAASAGNAVWNAAALWLTVKWLRRMRWDGGMATISAVAMFLAAAASAGMLAAGGATLLWFGLGSLPRQPAAWALTVNALGQALGIVATVPLLLAWRRRGWRLPAWKVWLEAGVILALLVVMLRVFYLSMGHHRLGPLPLPVIPVVVWAALRLGGSGICMIGWSTLAATLYRFRHVVSPHPMAAYVLAILIATATGLLLAGTWAEREGARWALQASERRFRAMVERSGDAFALLSRDGSILYGGPSTSRQTGYALDEVVGRGATAFLHPADRRAVMVHMARLLRQNHGSVRFACRARFADGRWHWVEAQATNLLAAPEISAVVVNYRDVSERRRLEASLLQAQKLDAVGRLAAGVAHEFNNLLTIIQGRADLLLHRADNGDACSGLQQILRASDEAAALTKRLLAFSQQQPSASRELDLNQLLLRLEPDIRELLGGSTALRLSLAPNLPLLYADPSSIEQIVRHLASNARDALNTGGEVSLRTECADPEPGGGNRWVELAIGDNGRGMDPAMQARVFEPFSSTKAVGEGSGLGLAMVYGLVAESGGTISVESAPGAGTTFRVCLPVMGDGPRPLALHPALAARRFAATRA
jgi:PAS domain S-box-containing protein